MTQPKDHIIFPLDVGSEDEAKRLVELLWDSVGMFKVGLELFVRCGPRIVDFITSQESAGVFLDLKLHDIPATVARAMAGIAELNVRLTTVHCGESPRMLEAAVAASGGRVGVLAITVLTSVSAADFASSRLHADPKSELTHVALQRAQFAHKAGCAGVVCSGLEVRTIRTNIRRDFLVVTPGIRPAWATGAKDDQRRLATPAQALAAGADYLVIGRPIRDARDPRAAALKVAAEIAEFQASRNRSVQ
ncbi:MAG: orotidine-5'-phosphate decarboxylase [Desulfobacterales bacterium]|jgi:orotidine-5'-phosphate decarboxylase|nr:orotidine-5'-phosphate decarboxylase [Desulfobacterales bacterium]